MANYTYECPKCESQKEVTHKMLDSPTHICVNCGIEMFKRVPIRVVVGYNPFDLLFEKQDEKWRAYKARKNKEKRKSK